MNIRITGNLHGPTVFFLAGWPDTCDVFHDNLMKKLKPHYRLVGLTLPGFDEKLPLVKQYHNQVHRAKHYRPPPSASIPVENDVEEEEEEEEEVERAWIYAQEGGGRGKDDTVNFSFSLPPGHPVPSPPVHTTPPKNGPSRHKTKKNDSKKERERGVGEGTGNRKGAPMKKQDFSSLPLPEKPKNTPMQQQQQQAEEKPKRSPLPLPVPSALETPPTLVSSHDEKKAMREPQPLPSVSTTPLLPSTETRKKKKKKEDEGVEEEEGKQLHTPSPSPKKKNRGGEEEKKRCQRLTGRRLFFSPPRIGSTFVFLFPPSPSAASAFLPHRRFLGGVVGGESPHGVR